MAPRRDTGVITLPPLVSADVSTEKSDDVLYAEGRPLGKPCPMTINTRATMTVARLDINTGSLEELLAWLNALQVVSGRPSQFEGGVGRADPKAMTSADLGVHCQDHR